MANVPPENWLRRFYVIGKFGTRVLNSFDCINEATAWAEGYVKRNDDDVFVASVQYLLVLNTQPTVTKTAPFPRIVDMLRPLPPLGVLSPGEMP